MVSKVKDYTLLILLFGEVLLVTTVGFGHSLQSVSATETVIDSDGIIHHIKFQNSSSLVIVQTVNPLDWNEKIAGYNLEVDGQHIHNVDMKLNKSENYTKKINITSGINVNQDEHTVTFSTYGNSTQFNFTRKINSSNSGPIPTPKITNVEVTNGTIAGEPSAVAEVTIANPSKQLYSTKLMVHTVGTDGSLYPASVRPGRSRTITVELLDERGVEIAGEARLYTGNMSTLEGAIDQVEFAGQAGEDTSVWNTSYKPVRPTWMDNNYEYQNASYERPLDEKLSRGHEVSGIPLIYVGVALLVGGIALRKLR